MSKRYHVGLLAQDRSAVFQFRSSVDGLSCEILRYFGERETTKAAARARLRLSLRETLVQLNRDFPNKGFMSVRLS